MKLKNKKAEVFLITSNLDKEINFFENNIGFKLLEIYPADNPKFALLEGYHLNILLNENISSKNKYLAHIRIPVEKNYEYEELVSPSGHKIEFIKDIVEKTTPYKKIFEYTIFNNNSWKNGRAGMQYRDLIPSRYGGFVVASHIKVNTIGKVKDRVHFHDVEFQALYCLKGKVKLTYENQEEFILFKSGECILQPPNIKHKVIETYEPLEVIELTMPAEHVTSIDYSLELPNKDKTNFAKISKSNFLYYKDNLNRNEYIFPGFSIQNTGINDSSNKFGDLVILESKDFNEFKFTHKSKFLFYYIIEGSIELKNSEKILHFNQNDCFVLLPNIIYSFKFMSKVKIIQFSVPKVTPILL